MRILGFAAVLLLSAIASLALATPDRAAERTLRTAAANLEKGRGLLAVASERESNAARLNRLDRAL